MKKVRRCIYISQEANQMLFDMQYEEIKSTSRETRPSISMAIEKAITYMYIHRENNG